MPADESTRDKPSLGDVRANIGSQLQEYYAAMQHVPLSDHLENLLTQLKDAERIASIENAIERANTIQITRIVNRIFWTYGMREFMASFWNILARSNGRTGNSLI